MRTSIRNASVCALCEPKCLATSKCSARYISLRSKQGTVSLAPPGGCPLKAKGVTSKVRLLLILPSYEHSPKPLFFCSFKACLAFCRRYPLCFLILFIYFPLAFLFSLLLSLFFSPEKKRERREKEKRKKRKTGKTHQFPFMRFLRSLNTFESSGSNRMSSSILLQAEIMVE